MGYEKLGSDQSQLAGFGGGVVSEDGATLLTGESTGDVAIMFGSAALREIQAGVANGDFAITPPDPLATITVDNPLPYWTFTDVNSAGAITAKLVADGGAASGAVLRFTVASGTLTGKSATLTRFVPVASSGSRSFSFYAEATFESGTASTQSTAKLSGQFYKNDQTTTTGSPFTSDTYTFSSLVGETGIAAPDFYGVAPDLTTMTAPSDAAFVLLTITIATVATQSAARTVDLTEVRLAHGLPELLITDRDNPSNPPAIINASSDELSIQSGSGDYLLLRPATLLTAATTIGIQAGSGAATLQGGTTVGLIAPSGVSITTDGSTLGTLNVGAIADTGDLNIGVGGGDLILQDTAASLPRLLYRDSAGTFLGGIQMQGENIFRFFNGSTTNDYGYLYAERIYPMNGTTASRYIYDDGSKTAFTGGIDTAGSINTSGSILNDSISTTTATANAAIWVLSSGTSYTLRRNSSSARYKTKIVDADDHVLQAARRITARHYESTIADEAGATRLGFIAEEVEAAGLSHAVGYDADGRPETLDSTALIAALYVRVDDLEARLAALEGA
jgi:hypothetical protein